MISDNFAIWDHNTNYWGVLFQDTDPRFQTKLYGFQRSEGGFAKQEIIPMGGACYGFVTYGEILIWDEAGQRVIREGEFFSTKNGFSITFDNRAVACVINQAIGFLGYRYNGGPIEAKGRLKYIDTCSDSLLIPPQIKGDPCFNHLHFPEDVDQTMHTHPSLRSGIVAKGYGECETPDGIFPLIAGSVFSIPKDGKHKFRTPKGSTMDVIAYHPDSDWGPTHEEHPMINRTWIDGSKMDNSKGVHATAQYIIGRE